MTVTVPYTFVGGTVIAAAQVNANFATLTNAVNVGTRDLLQVPTTFYVSPSGADVVTNGLTAATPWRTITYAYNTIGSLFDLNMQSIAILLAAGTYNESVAFAGALPGQTNWFQVTIQGASPGAVTVTGDPAFNVTNGALCLIQGMTIQSSVSSCIESHYHARVRYQNIIFGPNVLAHLLAARGGSIQSQGDYTISGGGGAHGQALEGGQLFIDRPSTDYVDPGTGFPTVTLSGTPSFSLGFMVSQNNSVVRVGAVFSGGATGPRSLTNRGGMININGAGATYLPGSSPTVDQNGGLTI